MKQCNYIFAFISILFISKGFAQGYRAGDITYKWLYGYTYEVKYTTYETYISTPTHCFLDSACFGDATHSIIARSNGSSIGCSPAKDGIQINPTIKLSEYVTIHTFAGPGNYNFCLEAANRVAGVINVPNSLNTAISFESSLLISPFIGPNSSPTFSNIAIAYGCMSAGCFTYNPLAHDADGDSLVYSILPYSYMGSSLPGVGVGASFGVDAVTGTVTWCTPQLAGIYNVAIKIEEWRKNSDATYTLVGYVIRDTEFIISTCTVVNEINNNDNSTSVFPNPNNGVFTIESNALNGYSSLQILTILGEVVYQETITNTNTTIDIQHLPNGIYILKMMDKNHYYTKKIIKH